MRHARVFDGRFRATIELCDFAGLRCPERAVEGRQLRDQLWDGQAKFSGSDPERIGGVPVDLNGDIGAHGTIVADQSVESTRGPGRPQPLMSRGGRGLAGERLGVRRGRQSGIAPEEATRFRLRVPACRTMPRQAIRTAGDPRPHRNASARRRDSPGAAPRSERGRSRPPRDARCRGRHKAGPHGRRPPNRSCRAAGAGWRASDSACAGGGRLESRWRERRVSACASEACRTMPRQAIRTAGDPRQHRNASARRRDSPAQRRGASATGRVRRATRGVAAVRVSGPAGGVRAGTRPAPTRGAGPYTWSRPLRLRLPVTRRRPSRRRGRPSRQPRSSPAGAAAPRRSARTPCDTRRARRFRTSASARR